MAARVVGSSCGAGLSSISFWCRRCIVQSRSQRWTTLPCVVGQHLDLDVAGMLDVLFQVDVGVAEGGLGLGLGLLNGGLQGQVVQRHAHAAPAAAGRRLDQHREADLVGDPQRPRPRPSTSPSLPGTVGTSTSLGQPPGGVLVAHQGHRLVRGADELDLATAADLGEVGVLGQKAVARVDRLHVADLGGADHAVDLQVAVRRPWAARRNRPRRPARGRRRRGRPR